MREVIEMEEIVIKQDEAVEIITLNRPERYNAFTFDMIRALTERFEQLAFDDDVRAVLVTGAGDAFCAGADLTGAGGREDSFKPLGMRITAQAYSRLAQSVWSLEKPVVAAVNGIAAGAGCNFALSCDIVLASESAKFIEVFVRRGLIADACGTYFLPRLVGLAKAKELMFFGEDLSAEEAMRIGLISRVVKDEKLIDESLSMARKLAEGPTRAIGMMKSMLNRSFESGIVEAVEREGSLQGIAVSTEDFTEGVSSFLEKRKPNFKGK
ncbi:MAG: enoyl-CoA hydratase-related protein [Actinomycetota bacterium]|nr:enoyl-CoA hydratase-related protein [Actinomycetota bacterium]